MRTIKCRHHIPVLCPLTISAREKKEIYHLDQGLVADLRRDLAHHPVTRVFIITEFAMRALGMILTWLPAIRMVRRSRDCKRWRKKN